MTCSINHSLETELNDAVAAAMGCTRGAFGELVGQLNACGWLDKSVSGDDLMILPASVEVTDTTLGLRPAAERRQRIFDRIVDGLRLSHARR